LKIVDWNEYTRTLEELGRKIQPYKFDGVVAIGRGGSIIGAYLTSKLGIPIFYPIFVRHVGRGDDMKIAIHDLGQIKSLKGRLLVVDDWLCEGRAMRFVLDLIPKEASVTTMVMFNRKGSEFKPDFVGEYVEEKEREIMFPYDPLR